MARFGSVMVRAALSLVLLGNVARAAEPIPPSPIVHADLVLDAVKLEAGSVVWAGVHFTMPEHWHIYWQNPGDSGIPTTLDWTLPSGISAGDIVWPTPERLPISGLVNYGYSNEITLPVPLTVEAGIGKNWGNAH